MTGVYKIQNLINGKIYIGCSKNIEARWETHRQCYKYENIEQYGKKALYQAFRKYGIENFSFDVLEETDNYFEREKYWIAFYDSFGPNGYNLTKGGEGSPFVDIQGEKNPNAKLTQEEVVFIRDCAKRLLIPKEIYESFFQNKISYSHFKRIWNCEEDSWKNIGENTKIYIQSPEYLSRVNKYNRNCRKDVQDNLKRKQILIDLLKQNFTRMEAYQYYIKTYESDLTLSAFTHLWYDIKPKKEKQKIYKLDIKTHEILGEYCSFAEAGRENNCDSSSISKVCKGKRAQCGGFSWIQK